MKRNLTSIMAYNAIRQQTIPCKYITSIYYLHISEAEKSVRLFGQTVPYVNAIGCLTLNLVLSDYYM